MKNKIIQGNSFKILPSLPEGLAHCCVTSPPYWQLRDYDIKPTVWPEVTFPPMPGLPEITIPEIKCCYGLESDIWAYIGHTVQIFREVRRVLRNDGSLWFNIGDSYCSNGGAGAGDNGLYEKYAGKGKRKRNRTNTPGIKKKDMYAMPWRLAFALQADGWYLRQDIIWSKPCPTPEPMMKDRCTKAHEYVFLFSKSKKYYFDSLAIAEPYKEKTKTVWNTKINNNGKYYRSDNSKKVKGMKQGGFQKNRKPGKYGKAPKKSVWTMRGAHFSEGHFAVFPEKLIIPCIRAGCPVDGIVLDPFGGAGTTALVARKLNRNYLLIEIKPEYADMAENRLREEIPLFV